MSVEIKEPKVAQKVVMVDPDKHELLKEVSARLYNAPLSSVAGVCIKLAYDMLMRDPDEFMRLTSNY